MAAARRILPRKCQSSADNELDPTGLDTTPALEARWTRRSREEYRRARPLGQARPIPSSVAESGAPVCYTGRESIRLTGAIHSIKGGHPRPIVVFFAA